MHRVAQVDHQGSHGAAQRKHAEYPRHAWPWSCGNTGQHGQGEQKQRTRQLEPAPGRVQVCLEHAPVGREFPAESADIAEMQALVEQVEDDQVGRRDRQQGKCQQDQETAQQASPAQRNQGHQAQQAGPQPGVRTEGRGDEAAVATGIGADNRINQPGAAKEQQRRSEHDADQGNALGKVGQSMPACGSGGDRAGLHWREQGRNR